MRGPVRFTTGTLSTSVAATERRSAITTPRGRQGRSTRVARWKSSIRSIVVPVGVSRSRSMGRSNQIGARPTGSARFERTHLDPRKASLRRLGRPLLRGVEVLRLDHPETAEVSGRGALQYRVCRRRQADEVRDTGLQGERGNIVARLSRGPRIAPSSLGKRGRWEGDSGGQSDSKNARSAAFTSSGFS